MTQDETTLPYSGRLCLRYQEAFDLLNDALFESRLPDCVLNFSARGNSLGFFTPEGWNGREHKAHSIDLNPVLFQDETSKIMETLLRCMLSLWEHTIENRRPRRGYYTKAYIEKATSLGLVMTERPGSGGQSYTSEIQRGGKFWTVLQDLPQQNYFPLSAERRPGRIKKPATMQRYICNSCDRFFMAHDAMEDMRCPSENCQGMQKADVPEHVVKSYELQKSA